METTTIDVFEALQELPDRDAAKKIADYIEESKQLNFANMKEVFATKEDVVSAKLEIIQRLDTHFKWLIGILIAFFSIAIAILKH